MRDHDLVLRAVVFDLNGTLSDDEPLFAALYVELLADEGVALTEAEYWTSLAGLADDELLARVLPRASAADRARIARARVERYLALTAASPTIGPDAVAAVHAAAAHGPVAVCSGSSRVEVEHVLRLAGLLDALDAVVCAEDVPAGKPDPAGYELACGRLGVPPSACLAVEDTDAGVLAARAAGLRVAALPTPALTLVPDVLLPRLDATTVRGALGAR